MTLTYTQYNILKLLIFPLSCLLFGIIPTLIVYIITHIPDDENEIDDVYYII